MSSKRGNRKYHEMHNRQRLKAKAWIDSQPKEVQRIIGRYIGSYVVPGLRARMADSAKPVRDEEFLQSLKARAALQLEQGWNPIVGEIVDDYLAAHGSSGRYCEKHGTGATLLCYPCAMEHGEANLIDRLKSKKVFASIVKELHATRETQIWTPKEIIELAIKIASEQKR